MTSHLQTDSPEARFVKGVNDLLDSFVNESQHEFYPTPSALEVAMKSGLPAKMTYSVSECGKFTGLGQDKLRRDHEKGLIDFIEPDGERGARIGIMELDRYLKDIGVIL